MGAVMDRFTLMLHFTSHRQLFNKDYKSLNHVIPWLLGPFFGQTPNTYFAHHMGMHHREENLPDDLSSTMRFTRNRITHWLRYYLRFLFIGLPELTLLLLQAQELEAVRSRADRAKAPTGRWWAWALWLRPEAALVVFVDSARADPHADDDGQLDPTQLHQPRAPGRSVSVEHYLHQHPVQPALLQRRLPHSSSHQAARALDRAPDRVRKGAARIRQRTTPSCSTASTTFRFG